ncbi:MAG: hypothetical protein ACXWNI_01405 [Candidatus Limnocylindrales bacterium]
MSFWSRGPNRKEEAKESPAVVAATAVRLAVVEFWAATERTLAGVDLSHGRLTDLINHTDFLRVLLLDEMPEDPSQPIEMRAGQEWAQLSVGDVLLILPPPQPADPQRRLHRPRQPVEIAIGPFRISGMVHTPPGAQAAGFLLRQNNRFAPVTRAAVRDIGLEGFEQRADVVLVNMRRVDKIQDIGLDQPEPLPSTEASAPIV